MINAAIVGLGRWGQTLVKAVQGKSDKLRFIRAVSRDPAGLREIAAPLRLEVTGEVGAVLADRSIDAVVLATPHSLHCEQIIAVAAAGKAVFCEKPLTLTKAEAERAIDACRKAGVVLGVGTDKRFFPAVHELLRIAKTGELGRLLHLEAHFSNEVAATHSEWRNSPEESPAGGMTGTGVHMLDALVALAGPVRRVQALLLSHKPPPDPLDSLSAVLEFVSGVSGTLAMVRSTPTYFRLHAFGREASAEVLGRTELVVRRSGKAPQHLSFREATPVDSVRANLEAFADAVAGSATYPIPTSDMLATLAAFEAITDAAKSWPSSPPLSAL
ncbi:MAG: Gfo/Idh/MocA family oxidoreductase [Alphaproteobacteria bacterium]|nr:Gfo/Idh/MocA family oxidoreductase [Alphaproteobacteria bacterium]